MADVTTVAEAPKTTTSGAQSLLQTNAWLTAAAVAVYATKALWIKLRELGLGKKKSEACMTADIDADNELVFGGHLAENSIDQETRPLPSNGQFLNLDVY